MSQINQALGVHGAGFPLTVDGKEYRLYPLPKGMQGEMEAALENVQWQRANRVKPHMTEEEWEAFRSDLVKRIMNGEFHYENPAMNKWLTSPDGLTLWVTLMLRCRQPDITDGEVENVIMHVNTNPDALEMLYPKSKAPETANHSGANG